jgi:hypothetical protein
MEIAAKMHLYKKVGENIKRSIINMPLGLEYQLISGLRDVVFFDGVPIRDVETLVCTAKKLKLIVKILPIGFQYNQTEDKFIPAKSVLNAMLPVVVAKEEKMGNRAFSVFSKLMSGGLTASDGGKLMTEAGNLLGYPECCVRNFVNLPDEMTGNTAALFQSYRNSATTPNLLLVSHFRLIEHLPCTYSCEASLRLAKRTLSAINNQGRAFRSFVSFVNSMNELALLTWSTWKTVGFINPRLSGEITFYDSFYIFEGPAKASFKEIQNVAQLLKRSEAFSIKNGDAVFYAKRGSELETSGMIPADFHPSAPEILLWDRL